MNETLRKYTEEVRAKLAEAFKNIGLEKFITETKAAKDSGSFEVVISTDNLDRQGEVIKQDGWELDNYLKNPIVLWGHDYWSLPIGITDEIYANNGKLVARGHFAPEEANPFAQQIRRLYDLKIVRATSVGFIAKESEGGVITKAELLEFSFVAVPANPYALSMRDVRSLNLDLAMLATKGIQIKVEKSPACRQEGESEEDCRSRKISEMEGEGMDHDQAVAAAIDMCKTSCAEKSKGQVGDALSEEERWKQKWAKLNPVWDVFDAFIDVYLNEKTAVEDFDNLVTEMTDIIRGKIGKGLISGQTKNRIPGALKGIERAFKSLEITSEKDVQQIAVILVQLQNVINEALVNASKLIITIVETEYGQSVAGKTEIAKILKSTEAIGKIKTAIGDLEAKLGVIEGEDPAGALKQRSQDAGGAAIKDYDEFKMSQHLLRSVATVVSESLERLNKKEREKRNAHKS